jgi:hypothetical protein
MNDLVEVRVNKLIRISDHCRHLVNGLLPPAVGIEIAQMADEYEAEAARVERVCRETRCCPCEWSDRCLPVH